MYGIKITQREEISPNNYCCAEPHETPTSGPQNHDPTVQNVALAFTKLLTKYHHDPTVQSTENDNFLQLGAK